MFCYLTAMACTENTVTEKFTFYWNIKNLRYNILERGEYISSPKFSLPNFQNTTWSLRLYPLRNNETDEKYFSLFLTRENDTGPETIHIEFEFDTCYLDKPFTLETAFTKNKESGVPYFVSQTCSYTNESSFLIVCTMRCSSVPTLKQISNAEIFLPSMLKSNCPTIISAVDKLKIKVNAEISKTKNKFFTWPKQCETLTQFCTETKFLEWPIDYSTIKDVEYRQEIPAIFSQTNYSLMVILIKSSDEVISMHMHLVNGNSCKSLLVVCKLSLLINETETTLLFNNSHEFCGKEENVWCLEEAFKVPDIERKLKEVLPGMARYKFEFTFANGEIHSEILKESSNTTIYEMPMYIHSGLNSNQLKQMYKERELCDVELKVKDKTFHVHRMVLFLMSPVFSAMFSSETEENKTGIVNIEDLEEDVVSDMIYFLYNGNLENLEFQKAQKLFSAADKYQIIPLKNLCRNILIDNLNRKNICPILCLADLHNDSKLEAAALEIICLYKNSVLLSENWKILEEENTILANKILKKVYFRGN